MEISYAQSANCELAPSHEFFFPTPQVTTMTIARSTNMTHAAPLPMMRSTSGDANPMMRVTLPKELGDDPLASPIGNHPLTAFSNEPEVKKQQPEPEPEPTHTTSSGFFTRRRQLSIEKKPPMAPSLRRTTSLPMKNASLFSKMAPMLKRVVSGAKSHSEFPEEGEEDDDADNSRESLLMLLRVPEIQRVSLIPLMMASHSDY